MSLKGFHTNGDVCANQNCAVPHYASAGAAADGRRQLEWMQADVDRLHLEIPPALRRPMSDRDRDAVTSLLAGESVAEWIARSFHEAYERLAPEHGYETREASAKPWAEVPENNRLLMIAVVADLLDRGVIRA